MDYTIKYALDPHIQNKNLSHKAYIACAYKKNAY